MADSVLVLNAGSSSVKFSLFVLDGAVPRLAQRGQIEALFTAPRFTARDADDAPAGERTWAAGSALGHEGAVAFLLEHLRAPWRSIG